MNSLSLRRYLQELADQYGLEIEFGEIPDDILTEFKSFGLQKIGDLTQIADDRTLRRVKYYSDEAESVENAVGFVRTLMMYHDIDRYFSIWKRWSGLDVPTAHLLEEKYGEQKMREILARNHVSIEDEGEYNDEDDRR